jgi:RNA polymerase sigma-70 factor (ECF subfamily)
MQEALVRVWERWDRVAGMDDPTGYLYRTAMNVLHSRVRRARTALRRSFRREPSTDALAAVEDRDSMSRRLARLTPRQRAVVVLVDLLEFTSEEAAQALGIRASTVRVLASRAHATLREEPNDG